MVYLVAALLGVLAAVYVERTNLLTWAGAFLIQVDPAAKADAIIVLGGSTGERELEAADLYRAGWAPSVVLTTEREPLAMDVMRQRGIEVERVIDRRIWCLTQLGVPRRAVVVLPRTVLSTFDEANAVRDWVHDSHVTRLLVVTSPFHTRRSKMAFARALRDTPVTLQMHAAPLSLFRPETWWQDRETLKDGLAEWSKLAFYRFRYW
jgi:uncharacterized SAM-binding protein YcdF (DUF218 family)